MVEMLIAVSQSAGCNRKCLDFLSWLKVHCLKIFSSHLRSGAKISQVIHHVNPSNILIICFFIRILFYSNYFLNVFRAFFWACLYLKVDGGQETEREREVMTCSKSELNQWHYDYVTTCLPKPKRSLFSGFFWTLNWIFMSHRLMVRTRKH